MKKRKDWCPYAITYGAWLSFLLLVILTSKTEDGQPYPVITGIAVSFLCALPPSSTASSRACSSTTRSSPPSTRSSNSSRRSTACPSPPWPWRGSSATRRASRPLWAPPRPSAWRTSPPPRTSSSPGRTGTKSTWQRATSCRNQKNRAAAAKAVCPAFFTPCPGALPPRPPRCRRRWRQPSPRPRR